MFKPDSSLFALRFFLGVACLFATLSPASAQDNNSAINNPTAGALPPAVQMTDEQYLKKGIEFFKAGSYREALGQFGMALPREFNNAVLHYYMANTLINLKQNEAAIREFRIAYALAPRQDVGQLSRKALIYLGGDNFSDGMEKVVEKPSGKKDDKALEALDPVFAKTIETLRRQSGSTASMSDVSSSERALSNRIDDMINRSKSNIADSIVKMNPDDLKVPKDIKDQLIQIKLLNDAKYRLLGRTMKVGDSVRDSAESLQALLKEKNSKSAPHLVPHGTNLYIRNYKAPGTLPEHASTDGGSTSSRYSPGAGANGGAASAGASINGASNGPSPGAAANQSSSPALQASSKTAPGKFKGGSKSGEKPTKLWGVTLR